MASNAKYYTTTGNVQQTPIIVQGRPYNDNNKSNKTGDNQSVHFSKPFVSPFTNNNGRAHVQQNGYRDVLWAVLFYIQFVVIIGLAIAYIPQMQQIVQSQLEDNANNGYDDGSYRKSFRMLKTMMRRHLENGDYDEEDYDDEVNIFINIFPYYGIAFVGSILLIVLSMSLMFNCAEILIKISLILNILMSLAAAIGSLLIASIELVLLWSFATVVTLYYTCCVWKRIPFAAANLTTAVTAVQANIGLVFYSFISVLLVFAWAILWVTTFFAVTTVLGSESCDEYGQCSNTINGVAWFFLLVSFYWTAGVITNVVYVFLSIVYISVTILIFF
jgi:hypothetical protein